MAQFLEMVGNFFVRIGHNFYDNCHCPILKTITVIGVIAMCIGWLCSKRFRDIFF